jgi:hypothetical protein
LVSAVKSAHGQKASGGNPLSGTSGRKWGAEIATAKRAGPVNSDPALRFLVTERR